jgi:thiamine-phosphate pyrophosphorylase
MRLPRKQSDPGKPDEMAKETPDATHGRQPKLAALRGIYALVDPERRAPEPFVAALLAGGIRLFQIRAKNGMRRDTLTAIVALVRAAGGITLVNDDVAAAAEADGVHLGQEDAALHDLAAVRIRLKDGIIGLSCSTPAEARVADPAIIDYLGVGPLFATNSKLDAGPPIGVGGVHAVVAATMLPTAAIGGIDLASLQSVRETGVTMAAIISALSDAADVAATARAMVAAWNT